MPMGFPHPHRLIQDLADEVGPRGAGRGETCGVKGAGNRAPELPSAVSRCAARPRDRPAASPSPHPRAGLMPFNLWNAPTLFARRPCGAWKLKGRGGGGAGSIPGAWSLKKNLDVR